MRKRRRRVEVCFTDNEFFDLVEKAKKSHLSIGEMVRRTIKDVVIKEAPPAEYYELIREVRRNGYNINQLLKIANTRGLLDVPLLQKSLEENRETEKMLWRVFQREQ